MKYIFILTLLFSASCGQSTDSKVLIGKRAVQLAEVGKEKLTENALTFINSYVDNCNKMKKSVEIVEWVNSSKLATQNFKTELKKTIDKAYEIDPEIGLGADPIFNAQDYPDKGFELDSLDDKTNYVVVKGKNWGDFKLTIKMVKENNNWLVDGCGIINVPNDKRNKRSPY